MKRPILWVIVFLVICGLSTEARGQTGVPDEKSPPTLTVTGHGEVSAPPGRATVRLGAVAQAQQAADAQSQVNQVMDRALERLKALNVPPEHITTVGLLLTPVYSGRKPGMAEEPSEPRIVGYRANHTIKVEVDDPKKIGEVIDAGVAAGANQLEGISFELKDDTKQVEQALRMAAGEARAKAEAIADAMHIRIVSVEDVLEGGVNIVPPSVSLARTYAAEAATPVQPGQVEVRASVTVRYRIADIERSGQKQKE